YRRDAEAWMLGRFVIPASRLGELEPYRPLFSEGLPFAFSVLGRGGESPDAFIQGLRDDLEAVSAFEKRHSSRVVADVLEGKWPTGSAAETMNLFEVVADSVELHPRPLTLTPYFEVGLGGDWRRTVAGFVTELKHFREDRAFRKRNKCRPPGLKLRC